MARFYLHMYNRIGFLRDEEGEELPDLEAAREKAIDGMRSVLADEARGGKLDLRGRMEVVDETGEIVAVIPFSEAVEVCAGEGPDSEGGPRQS